jgi:hypothetical protein
VHPIDQALDLTRVLAKDDRRQGIVDDMTHGLGRTIGEALAPAGEPVVGDSADEDLFAGAGRPRRGRADLLERDRQGDCAELGDLHFRGR